MENQSCLHQNTIASLDHLKIVKKQNDIFIKQVDEFQANIQDIEIPFNIPTSLNPFEFMTTRTNNSILLNDKQMVAMNLNKQLSRSHSEDDDGLLFKMSELDI